MDKDVKGSVPGEPGQPTTADPAGEIDESVESVPLYRKKRVLIPAAVLLIAVAAGWYWYVANHGYVSTDDAYVDGDRVSISPKMLGRITSLAVDEGDTVLQGQILVRLDTTDLAAQREQAVAALRFARESVGLAEANLRKAEDDFQRAKAQFSSAVIPKEQYDHAASARDAARAENSIALARIGTAKAQVDVIRAQLDNTVIASPITGVVAKRWVLAGDVVQPGQPIYTVYSRKNLWVTANFEETKLASIHPGDPVEISVDAYPDRTFRGKVLQIGSSTASQFSLIPPNNASGNFTKVTQRVPVKISLDADPPTGGHPAIALLPGMSVEVNVKTE